MRDQASAGRPMATLRLFADGLIPAEIDRITAIKPDLAAQKGGNLLKRHDGGFVAAKTGTWFVTTEDKDVGRLPEDHLGWVVGLVARHAAELRDAVPGLQIDLSLLVHDASFKISGLPADLVEQAVRFGDLEIEVPGSGIDVIITPGNVANFAGH